MSRQLAPLETAIPPAKLAHFVLRTADLPRLKAWYQQVLGARVVFENPMLAFLTYDDEHHRLALAHDPDATPRGPRSVGLHHVAFTFADLGQLLQTYARLAEAGLRPVWCVNHGPTTSMYYEDPDGNQVELQIDNFESVEALNDWFRTDAFKANPLGTTFDPDKLRERYERGDPLDELVKQGSA